MIKCIVACVGSPYGSDIVAIRLSSLLRQRLNLLEIPDITCQVNSYDRPGIGLLNDFKLAHMVFIIDAIDVSRAGNKGIGELVKIKIEDLISRTGPMSSHEIGVAEMIALGRELEYLPKHTQIIGVTMNPSIDWQASPAELEGLVNKAVHYITADMKQLMPLLSIDQSSLALI